MTTWFFLDDYHSLVILTAAPQKVSVSDAEVLVTAFVPACLKLSWSICILTRELTSIPFPLILLLICSSELNSVACNPMNNNNTIYKREDQNVIIKNICSTKYHKQ